jgi:hypothetical protein
MGTGVHRAPDREPRHDPDTNMRDMDSIKQRIAELHLEHRGLDAMINAIGEQPHFDELQLRRLKKRKLQIKDTIMLLQMQLVPDVPA